MEYFVELKLLGSLCFEFSSTIFVHISWKIGSLLTDVLHSFALFRQKDEFMMQSRCNLSFFNDDNDGPLVSISGNFGKIRLCVELMRSAIFDFLGHSRLRESYSRCSDESGFSNQNTNMWPWRLKCFWRLLGLEVETVNLIDWK